MSTHFEWRLFKRNGVYYADGRRATTNLGKHSLGTRDRATAMTRLQQLDAQKAVEAGLVAPQSFPSAVCDLSISDGWQKYMDFAGRGQVLGGASEATLKRYRAVRDSHLAFCAKRGIGTWNSFGKKQLEEYGNCRSRQRADRTVYLELTTLKSVSKWLAEEKLIPADGQLRYALAKPKGTDTYCYNPSQVGAMVDHCRATADLHWLADLIVTLAHTGMRIGEAANLRWSDIDMSAGTLRVADERSSDRKRKLGVVRTTKSGRSRVIPIHPHLRGVLQAIARTTDGRVLHALRGGRLRPRNVLAAFIEEVIEPLKDVFSTAEGEIGFQHGRLHSFRHFFCSQAFLGGASEGEVREWLGHADSKMVEHYRHLRSEDALRRMGQLTFLPAVQERSAAETEFPSVSSKTEPDQALTSPGSTDKLDKTAEPTAQDTENCG